MSTQPKVTVIGLSYNHKDFIAQALDSMLMQHTNFPFEIIMGDDCSTDGTADILRSYASRYPDIIKPVLRERNIGISSNVIDTFGRARSEYVALCEGDDCWTDKHKLQTQVDFLEAHRDCAVSFHPVRVRYEDGSKPDELFPSPEKRFNKTTLALADLLVHNFIQTTSVMYRWRFAEEGSFAQTFPRDILPCDWLLHLLHAERGTIGFIDREMGLYRRHSGGCWWDKDTDTFYRRSGLECARFYHAMQTRYARDYRQPLCEWVMNTLFVTAALDDEEHLARLFKEYQTIYGAKIEMLDYFRTGGSFGAEVRKQLLFLFDIYIRTQDHKKLFDFAKMYYRIFEPALEADKDAAEFNHIVLDILYKFSDESDKYKYYKKKKSITL